MLESGQINRTTPAVISHGEAAPEREAAPESTPASLLLQLGLIREAALILLDQLEPLGQEQTSYVEKRTPSLYDEVRRFEIQLISNALSQTRGHQKEAARLLGIKATTLNSKIKRYKLLPFARGWFVTGRGATVEDAVAG